ncbi:hypothetical protein BRC79_03445 [Halobacteriales archaeon QH_8_67_27]|nr:MAG: hypothetical protein BRC79_03445 [Halobacteriales archaeon QH_8_67_27]
MVAATVDEVENDVSAIVDAAAAVPVGGPAAGIDELADGHSAGVARILGDSVVDGISGTRLSPSLGAIRLPDQS